MVMMPYHSQASRQPDKAISSVTSIGKTNAPEPSPIPPMTSAQVRFFENHLSMIASHIVRCSREDATAPTPP